MRSVEDLLWAQPPGPAVPRPEMDPLTEVDALQEAQLLDVRVHALSSTVGLLFEMRTALQLRAGNAAVLAAHGAIEFTWSAESRLTSRTAWNVVGSEPAVDGSTFSLELDFWPSSLLNVVATSAAFYVIEVPGLGESPPNYLTDDEVRFRAGLPSWDSQFSPIQTVFFDPSNLNG